MVYKATSIDYKKELKELTEVYSTLLPSQRLNIIRQRLEDHHYGPNRLVTCVSAVEAFARTLVMHKIANKKFELKAIYRRFKKRSPIKLVEEYMKKHNIEDVQSYFKEDTWELFKYAVEYRNLLTHECTYLGLDKFPSLISACEEILEKLVILSRTKEK